MHDTVHPPFFANRAACQAEGVRTGCLSLCKMRPPAVPEGITCVIPFGSCRRSLVTYLHAHMHRLVPSLFDSSRLQNSPVPVVSSADPKERERRHNAPQTDVGYLKKSEQKGFVKPTDEHSPTRDPTHPAPPDQNPRNPTVKGRRKLEKVNTTQRTGRCLTFFAKSTTFAILSFVNGIGLRTHACDFFHQKKSGANPWICP